MIASKKMAGPAQCSDAELVAQCREGSREAFAQVVERYQSLICALTYNATGTLSQSEDLAQETFITAWKQLHKLREAERLRPWLCGIARNLARNLCRANQREPVSAPEPLECLSSTPAPEPQPSEHAIRQEEDRLLWRALENIPALYREPMILFYREQQSVERVAESLDISQDVVKQRLARGRRMLEQELVTYVEGALQRTRPGKTFTTAVVAALPLFAASSAGAVTIGSVGAKASTVVKASAAAGLTGAVLGPLLGLMGGAFGAWASITNTRSARERQFMVRQTWKCAGLVLAFLAALCTLTLAGRSLAREHPAVFGSLLTVLVVGYCITLVVWIRRSNQRQRQIRIEDGTAEPVFLQPPTPTARQQFWAVYGSLGGGTVGALAWLEGAAIHFGDWLTAVIIVVFGFALVLIAGRIWIKDLDRRKPVLVGSVGVLGLFQLILGLVHREDWVGGREVQNPGETAVLVGAVLMAISIVITLQAWVRQRFARNE